MATTQTFQTIIRLNAQEAKNEMAALQKNLDDLKKKKADALRDPGTSVKDINKFNKQIKAAELIAIACQKQLIPLIIYRQHRSETSRKLHVRCVAR